MLMKEKRFLAESSVYTRPVLQPSNQSLNCVWMGLTSEANFATDLLRLAVNVQKSLNMELCW